MGRVRRVRWVRLPPSSATTLRPEPPRARPSLPCLRARARCPARPRPSRPTSCWSAAATATSRCSSASGCARPPGCASPSSHVTCSPPTRECCRPRRRPLPDGRGAYRSPETLAVRECTRHSRSRDRDRPCGAEGPGGRPTAHRLRRPLPRHRLAADHGRDRGGEGARPRDQADRRLPGTVGGGRARLPQTGRAAPGRGDWGRSRGDRAVALPPTPPSDPPRPGRGAGRGRDHPARGDARGCRVARPGRPAAG